MITLYSLTTVVAVAVIAVIMVAEAVVTVIVVAIAMVATSMITVIVVVIAMSMISIATIAIVMVAEAVVVVVTVAMVMGVAIGMAVAIMAVAMVIAIAEIIATMGLVVMTMTDCYRGCMMVVMISVDVISAVIMDVAMHAVIGVIAVGQAEVVVVMIVVDIVDAEGPATCCGVDRAEEIIEPHEDTELGGIQDVAKILVTIVKVIVVGIDGVGIAIDNVIHQTIGTRNEVIVHLVAVFVLSWGQLELISHTVCEEAGCLADAGIAHSHHAR